MSDEIKLTPPVPVPANPELEVKSQDKPVDVTIGTDPYKGQSRESIIKSLETLKSQMETKAQELAKEYAKSSLEKAAVKEEPKTTPVPKVPTPEEQQQPEYKFKDQIKLMQEEYKTNGYLTDKSIQAALDLGFTADFLNKTIADKQAHMAVEKANVDKLRNQIAKDQGIRDPEEVNKTLEYINFKFKGDQAKREFFQAKITNGEYDFIGKFTQERMEDALRTGRRGELGQGNIGGYETEKDWQKDLMKAGDDPVRKQRVMDRYNLSHWIK